MAVILSLTDQMLQIYSMNQPHAYTWSSKGNVAVVEVKSKPHKS